LDVVGFHIHSHVNGDGGIQGFLDTRFYIDQFGVVANSFYVFSSKTMSLINDITARPVLIDAKVVGLVYPINKA
jgi:hypothetical protein